MSGKSNQQRKAQKAQRRQTRQAKRARHHDGPTFDQLPSAWLTDSDEFPEPPDEALLDTSQCPVGTVCAGCGNHDDLRAVTSAFSEPGGYTVACATLCGDCDGRSFVHLLSGEEFDQALARHAEHYTSTTA